MKNTLVLAIMVYILYNNYKSLYRTLEEKHNRSWDVVGVEGCYADSVIALFV